jgi:hypothetical protein
VALAEEGSKEGLERRAMFRRHVGKAAAGGGAATARGSASAAETAGAQRGPEEEERREGSEGPMCKTKRF